MASFILLALPLVAHATNLATVNPCTDCPTEVFHAPITVTTQFQVVSTCSASTTLVSSTLYRYYPCQPSTWVSTVIPTISNGQWGNVTVTQPDQKVTFSALSSVETITSLKTAIPTLHRRYQPPKLGFRAVNASSSLAALPIGRTSTGGAAAMPGVITSPTVVTETLFRTHEVYNCAPFGQMGPIALPGSFEGSPICTGAGPDERGALTQTVEVTSCLDRACTVTSQTWIQEPVPTVTHGTTTTITITRTVGQEAQPTSTCSSFKLKAVRDNTKFHHGAQGYLSFPGSEGVLDGKKEAGSFSLDGSGTLAIDGKHVCAARSGPLAKTQRACRGSWTLNEDGTLSYSARNDISFCFAKDKTVFSRNANRSGCKPVKFVAECVAPKQSPAAAPAAMQPLPQQTASPAAPNVPSYVGGGDSPTYGSPGPAPGSNSPTYGGGPGAPAPAPAPGSNSPSYNGNGPNYGGGAPAPAPGNGGTPAPAPGYGDTPPAYGGGPGVSPGLSTTCTESLGAQPTAQPPVYSSGGTGGPVAPSYGGSIPVYGSGSPLPLPTTTTTSCTLTESPTGPTRTTSNSLTDMPTGPTKTTSKSTSLTDKPTGPTRTTTTTDMSADPSAADPTAMPSPLRFEALGSRLMAREEDPLDDGDVGQKARRHFHRRARNAGRAGWWI